MNLATTIRDITPQERRLLSRLRFCPGVFLGEPSLRNFCHMSGGYRYAMQTAGLLDAHSLLPDGLNEFMARYLNVDPGRTRNCFTMIAEAEPDDAKALERFFVILDAYLVELGFKPLQKVESWTAFHEDEQ